MSREDEWRRTETFEHVDYGKLLQTKVIRAGIWGLGYVGYTTLLHLAAAGLSPIGFELDKKRARDVAQGIPPDPGLRRWLGRRPGVARVARSVVATASVSDVCQPDVVVHFVAVPTERNGEPWHEDLRNVFQTIATSYSSNCTTRPLVIIESTIMPGATETIILPTCRRYGLSPSEDILIAHAPRRDWFLAGEQPLRDIARVYRGLDEAASDGAESVLRLICDKLYRANDYASVELVKCVENAYRHMQITLANQLSLAFPDVDLCEVLELVATKWNMPSLHPSFGTGGHCIPLSSRYLLASARRPEELTLLKATVETDAEMREHVAEAIIRCCCRNVAVLGLAYRGGIKVANLSPALRIIQRLSDHKVNVRVYDPLYSRTEIADLVGVPCLDFPADLQSADAVVVCTDHQEFQDPAIQSVLLAKRKHPLLVLDNYGIWARWTWPPTVAYYRAGSPNWLSPRSSLPVPSAGRRVAERGNERI